VTANFGVGNPMYGELMAGKGNSGRFLGGMGIELAGE
jgi:hypothetical protein